MTEDLKTLRDKIEGIDIAMMTTFEDRVGTRVLHTRPMQTQEMDPDGTLWFFTPADSAKVDEIQNDSQVALSYAHPGKERYVSVAGRAHLVRDRSEIESRWKEILKAWFPEGKDDPNLALICVTPERAEYWDHTGGKAGSIITMIRSYVTGDQDHGQNEKLDDLNPDDYGTSLESGRATGTYGADDNYPTRSTGSSSSSGLGYGSGVTRGGAYGSDAPSGGTGQPNLGTGTSGSI